MSRNREYNKAILQQLHMSAEKKQQIEGKYLPCCPCTSQEACLMKGCLEEAVHLASPTSRQFVYTHSATELLGCSSCENVSGEVHLYVLIKAS